MTSWPSILPSPLKDGYEIRPQDGILRTEMEAGPARQRREYTQVPTRIPVKWLFTSTEYAVFESWYLHEAKEGSEWFEVELLGGLGLSLHEARLTRMFQAKPIGVVWEVTAEFEIRERPVLSREALDLALSENLDGLFAAIAASNRLVNVNLSLLPW